VRDRSGKPTARHERGLAADSPTLVGARPKRKKDFRERVKKRAKREFLFREE